MLIITYNDLFSLQTFTFLCTVHKIFQNLNILHNQTSVHVQNRGLNFWCKVIWMEIRRITAVLDVQRGFPSILRMLWGSLRMIDPFKFSLLFYTTAWSHARQHDVIRCSYPWCFDPFILRILWGVIAHDRPIQVLRILWGVIAHEPLQLIDLSAPPSGQHQT